MKAKYILNGKLQRFPTIIVEDMEGVIYLSCGSFSEKHYTERPIICERVADKLNSIAALEAENAKLREALKWAWDNLAKSTPYPDDESEYDQCAVCGQPEWSHDDDCELKERKLSARALLGGEG